LGRNSFSATFNTDEKAHASSRNLNHARRADGLLVIAGPPRKRNCGPERREGRLPLVTDRQLNLRRSTALPDSRPAVREGVTAMIRAGRRRTAASQVRRISQRYERRKGYMDALARAGIEVDSSLMLAGDYHRESGYRHAMTLLTLPSPPDGIFAANGMMALGIFDALMRLPLQNTQHMVIGHLDDLPFTPLPPWTVITVSQPTYEIGYQGTQLLLSRIRGEAGAGQKEIRLSSTIQTREKPANAFETFAGLAATRSRITERRSGPPVQRP
jgi:LacI family transcriptional regulator